MWIELKKKNRNKGICSGKKKKKKERWNTLLWEWRKKEKPLRNMHLYSKIKYYKSSFVLTWNVFVSYSDIFIAIVWNKYANAIISIPP